MGECELLAGCPFFNDQMSIESELGSLYKRLYCQGDKSKCARYMVATTLGADKVPATLYPNMLNMANEMIAEA